jgi:glycosyltransferase involved in cell wall biosynthesis
MAHLIGGLAQRHRVALLCLRADDEEGIEESLLARCEVTEEFAHRLDRASGLRERVRTRMRQVESVFALQPEWVTWCQVPDLARRLFALRAEWRPDIVQAEYHVMGQYLSLAAGSSRVLSQYEPGAHAARERWRAQGRDPRGYLAVRAWERYERSVAAQADVVVVLTARDREAMLPYSPSTPVEVIPLGIDSPKHALDPAGRHPPSILFVGNFHHPPNVEAAVRLVESIFPRVRERWPETELHLVGEAAPELSGPGVVVTGRVPSVEPWLDRAAVVAAPLASGGGMRVKVLEALAAGKAVVASPLAAEGLDGAPLILAETDDDTAAAIASLLEDPARRIALAESAREWVVGGRGLEHTLEAFEALYERLLS